MKCVVNWIPLRIRVRSRNTQHHLKVVQMNTRVGRAVRVNLICHHGLAHERAEPCTTHQIVFVCLFVCLLE